MILRSALKLIPRFVPFLKAFKLKFLIQALISQLIVKENVICIYQNLSKGVGKNPYQTVVFQLKSLSIVNLSPFS